MKREGKQSTVFGSGNSFLQDSPKCICIRFPFLRLSGSPDDLLETAGKGLRLYPNDLRSDKPEFISLKAISLKRRIYGEAGGRK